MVRAAHILAAALVVLLAAGCRTVNIASDYAIDPGKNSGVVVVSLTRSGLPSGLNMFVNYRGVDVDHRSAVPISDLFASADWRCPFFGTSTEAEPCGRLAVIELQPGEYEFYSWEGGSSSGPGGMTMNVRSGPFSKRFRVLPGKAVYLGNLHFAVQGPVVPFGGSRYMMKISDLRERDLGLFYAKHPNITPDRVVVSILPN